MKSNVPWSVKGIDPEARVVAKEAARKAGMTLGEWMNQMIREMGEEERREAEAAATGAPAPVSGVTTEQLRAVVDSLNRLNERLKTTEDGLKTTEQRQRQVAGDLGQGLETVFERMKRIERERKEGAPDGLATRVDALERGEGDRGRIEGLKKLESALTGMVEALEVTRAEALDKIEENEAAVQALASRVETLDDRLTQGFAEVHDAIDAVGQHLDRTERTAQAVIQDAKEAAASTDAQFVEATSKRLMILGTEIKRSGDQIRTVEDMVSRLSDKIEAAEHRSAEGIGEVATSLEALRHDVLGEGDAPDRPAGRDADQDAGQAGGRAGGQVESQLEGQAEGAAPSTLAESESLAEAAREADRKVSRLQRSYELMMARLEGRAPTDAVGEDEDTGTEARTLAAPTAASPADATGTPPNEHDETRLIVPSAAPTASAPTEDEAEATPREARPPEPAINDTVAAGLGLAPLVPPRREASQDADFDEVFGTPARSDAGVPPLPGEPMGLSADAARSGEAPITALSPAGTPLAATSVSVSAPLPPADEVGPRGDAAEGSETRADLARLTPRQKVLLAAKARKKRLEAERGEAGEAGSGVASDLTPDARPAAPSGVAGLGTEGQGEADAPLLAPDAPREAERGGRFGARNIGFAALFLVAAALVWFFLNPRGENEVAERPAPAEQAASGRLAAPAPASAPPAGPSARDLYAEGVAAYEAGRAEEAFGLFLRAEGDYVPARMRVGFALLNGEGTEANPSRARSYLLDAANVGNIAAMHLLGNIAAAEEIGGVNVADATDWFERAADHGNVNSMYNLGYLLDPTEEAQDLVPMEQRDAARAYEWYSLAASLGDVAAATEAAEVGAVLTPEARASIEARIADWTPLPLLAGVNDGLNPPEVVVTAPAEAPSQP